MDNENKDAVKDLVKAVGDNIDKLSDMDCAKIEGFIVGVASSNSK